jgi:hypothetical protein
MSASEAAVTNARFCCVPRVGGSAVSPSRLPPLHFANRALVTSAHPQCTGNAAAFRLWRVALILILACVAAPFTFAQEARLFVSSRAGDRLTEKPAVRFVPAESGPATFRLDPSVTHQTIVGFGASFLEAGEAPALRLRGRRFLGQ